MQARNALKKQIATLLSDFTTSASPSNPHALFIDSLIFAWVNYADYGSPFGADNDKWFMQYDEARGYRGNNLLFLNDWRETVSLIRCVWEGAVWSLEFIPYEDDKPYAAIRGSFVEHGATPEIALLKMFFSYPLDN